MTSGVFHVLEESPEEHKRRRLSIASACLAEALATGVLTLASAAFPNRAAHHVNQYVVLTFPSATEAKPVFKAPGLSKAIPKLPVPYVLPATRVEPPKVTEPQIRASTRVPNVIDQPPPSAPAVARVQLPAAPPPVVHTGVFGQAPGNPASAKAPIKQVQTGGFGNPQGVAGRAQGANRSNVPKLGTFDLAAGPGQGNGTGGAEGRAQVVAEAGFGNRREVTVINQVDLSDKSQRIAAAGFGGGGVATGGNGGAGSGGASTVKTGTFSAPEPAKAAENRAVAATPEIRPVEILSKPSPQYTAEARRLGVQGEVVLSVIFQADGTLKVLGVLRSLGHGLDQMAEQAASQIRFKPAEQDGKPTSFPAILHIEFRLA